MIDKHTMMAGFVVTSQEQFLVMVLVSVTSKIIASLSKVILEHRSVLMVAETAEKEM